jgi:hypothetical protein
MIDRYVASIVLVISNVFGLTALFQMGDPTPVDESFVVAPSTTVFSPPENYQMSFSELNYISNDPQVVVNTKSKGTIEHYGIIFKHGDVSWLPDLAAQAGWPPETWPMLEKIILRESGGCPNRRGGDVVNKNCIITNVSEWNHRSDTGLMQINGVNYNLKRNKWAAVCLQLDVCVQEPLLDPINNLKAGKVLYDLSGWGPWDPCTWGAAYAHRCRKDKP